MKLNLLFQRQFVIIYSDLQQCLDGVVINILAFHSADQGSIPQMHQNIFNFPFSQSHTSGVTKPSSLKLATSGITSPSNAEGIHKETSINDIRFLGR